MNRLLNIILVFIFLALVGCTAPHPTVDPNVMPKNFKAYIGSPWHSCNVEFRDGVTIYSKWEDGKKRKQTRIFPTPEQWQEFRHSLDSLNVWQWRVNYENPPLVFDGIFWSLDIGYSNQSLHTRGQNNYPDAFGKPSINIADLEFFHGPQPELNHEFTTTFQEYLAAIKKLIGDKDFN
jgi:hypothetical protein